MTDEPTSAPCTFDLDELFEGLKGAALLERIDWLNRLTALAPKLMEPGMGTLLCAQFDEPVARDVLAAICVLASERCQHDLMNGIARARERVPDRRICKRRASG